MAKSKAIFFCKYSQRKSNAGKRLGNGKSPTNRLPKFRPTVKWGYPFGSVTGYNEKNDEKGGDVSMT
jgi:hypothetical protein